MHNCSAKVAIVVASFEVGGIERVMITLANAFKDLGYKVDFLVCHNCGLYKQDLNPDIEQITLSDFSPGKVTLGRWLQISYRVAKYLLKNPGTKIMVSNRGLGLLVMPSWLFVPNKTSLFLCEAESIIDSELCSSFKKSIQYYAMRLFYKKATGIFSNSLATKNDLIRAYDLPKKKISSIYNPIPFKGSFDAKSQKEEKILLAVGRLVKNKNWGDVIDAFPLVKKRFPMAKLIILGEGPERDNLKNKIVKLGLSNSVFLEGFVRDPTSYYSKAHVLVHTSLWEGFGNVLVEAMSCGTPVVAYDCIGAIREVLEDGKYGKLVEFGNLSALASAIIDQIESPPSQSILMEAVCRFEVVKIAKQYLQCLNLRS